LNSSDSNRPLALVPRPYQCKRIGPDVHLPFPVPLYAAVIPEVLPILQTFADEIAPSSGVPVKLVNYNHEAGNQAGLSVEMNRSSTKPDSYHLFTTGEGVTVRASSPSGLFNGLQTWLQLCHLESNEVIVTGCEIIDQPRFLWRGMHLDISRHFFPVPFIKKYIDLLARHKMNIFHWHLCDDQGWRIEIKKYPRLTENGAWRTESDGHRYGGFYTQQDIRDVVDYARRRCVTVVPEIELPGHARAALAAYPQYSCTGGPFDVPTTWGVFEDVYCAGNDATFSFLEDILTEVAALFPGPLVHIGGDECPKERWRAHSLCQERMKREGLIDEDRLQSYFISRIAAHLKRLQKRLVGWDEILDGSAPSGAAVMAWRGTDKGTQAAQAGHDVVMCPGSHCYFDHYQAEPSGEPKAIGGFTPLDKIYAFEPIPDDLPAELHGRILGGQGNVWTEYMHDTAHVEYMTFPRLCALAEVLWSPTGGRSYDEFVKRLRDHLGRLDRLGVNYRRLAP
jgi:hexosaminidase